MMKRKEVLLSWCFSCLIMTAAHSQNLSGDWYGALEVFGTQYRLNLHIQSGDTLAATLDIPGDQAVGIPLQGVELEGNRFKFSLGSNAFEGVGSGDGQSLTGVFTLGDGSKQLLAFGRTPLPAPEGTGEWARERLKKQEVYISMRDGVRLFTSIYTPGDTTQTYPILIWRTPYQAEASEDEYSGRLRNALHFIKEGYIIVYQDVRGRYMSEGNFVNVRPFNPDKKGTEIDENSDTYDTIDWLVENVPNNNGRVGILGISYPGFYTTMALMDAHPALKAASPQAPVGDWFIGDDWHHNGAFFLMDAFSFYSTIGRPRPEPTRQGPSPFQWPNQDNYEFFLDLGPIKNVREHYFGDTIQFWSDLMSHPNYDDFWKARAPMPHLKNIRPAVLTVGGWFDAEDLYGPLATYQAIEAQNPASLSNRLIMGPWFHGQWSSGDGSKLGNVHWGSNTADYYKELELQFFNYYLKDKGELRLAEATIFDTGANEWRNFDHWPPGSAQEQNLYLHSGGGLSFSAPAAGESFDEYVSDPAHPVPYTEDVHLYRTVEYLTDDQRFAARRPDVMTYETEALPDPVTLTGPLEVEIWVSTTGTDADYVIKLIDVFPDDLQGYPRSNKQVPMQGYQMLVRGEVLRGRFRNSFEKPEPFEPGKPTLVRFTIPDVAHTFKAGHKMMIQVQNSWFPLVDRNPQKFVNIYECSEADFQKATHRIYHSAERPSHVRVRVLKD